MCIRDRYIQRIESDEDAVKIVTIHKSKGLEYEVVFAPFLDLTSWTKDIVEYRDADKGKYFFALNDKGELQRRNLDAIDQENRRLIYVALTRAIYKCYINVNYFRKFERASVKPFIEALKEKSAKSGWQNDLIEILKVSPVTPPERPEDNKEISLKESRSVEGIEQFVKTWDIHSFSSLSHKHEVITSEPAEINDPYDKFVFDELPRGAKAGLFLHSIFEHLDFNDPGTYEKAIDEAGSYYSTIFKLEHRQHYKNLVKHCMNAWVKDEKGVKLLQLKDVRQSEKLPELEFYFSLDRLRKSKIREIIKDVEFTTDPEIEGVMHGFIDLLFMHNNKYYILDLREKNSMIKWATDQGRTTFVISWVNPDEKLAAKSFEDYLIEGSMEAISQVCAQTGEDSVDMAGYCLGGTLVMTTLAYMAAKKDKRGNSGTFFTTMLDFSEPGELRVFLDEATVAGLEKKMFARGYHDGGMMAGTFNMLRANAGWLYANIGRIKSSVSQNTWWR